MLTRALAEALLLSRARVVLSEALGADAIPAAGAVDSPNAALGPFLGSALGRLGIFAADPTDPTDDEIGRVSDAMIGRFIDIAEYYALVSAGNQYVNAKSTVSAGQFSVSSSGSSDWIGKRIAALAAQYGIGTFQSPGIAVGNIPPWLARPQIPQSQNYPPLGYGRPWGSRGW